MILDVIAEGKQHVPDSAFSVPEYPADMATYAPHAPEASQTPGESAPEVAVDALVSETVAEVPVQEAVETPVDDRTTTERATAEQEDPNLYAVRNFSL